MSNHIFYKYNNYIFNTWLIKLLYGGFKMAYLNNCYNDINENLSFSSSNKWSEIPYPLQQRVYPGIDNSAGSYPLYFFKRISDNIFSKLDGNVVSFQLYNPCDIDFNTEQKQVEYIQQNLTPCQIEIAKFWGAGIPLNQWLPICNELLHTYLVTPAKSARILSSLSNVVSDAFTITWHFKYLYDYPRPCQLNRQLKTLLNTPKFPTYPSGHSVVSGAIEVILSYYFPAEAKNLNRLAEDASISRLYGGIHFKSDLTEGLRLGRQIGTIAVEYLKSQYDNSCVSIDYHYTTCKNAPIIPPYCKEK